MEKKIRLDKYLSNMGIGSRSQVKKWISKGRVIVNDYPALKPDIKVGNEDKVQFDGKLIHFEKFLYFMLNKPQGVVSATKDNVHKTVIDLIKDKSGKELFPVGRLDKDTEGLLLITNNGDFAHSILSPKKEVDKTYYARIEGRLTDKDKERLEAGVYIDNNYLTLPAEVKIIKEDDISEIELTIREGKYHQVKQMIKAVGHEVIYLKRISMAGLDLDENLKLGEYRPLNKEELKSLGAL